jgi:predicted site-specific integrase-resolvase
MGGRMIFVDLEEPKVETGAKRVYVYARVSSSEKREDLANQALLCEQFCAGRGLVVEKTFKEIASGMNDNRNALNKILDNPPDKLVVLYKDRLTRFGFNYLEKLLAKVGCEIIVVNKNASDQEDLLKDFVAIITSFCCRLYGARRGQAKALKMKENLKSD